MLFVLTVLFGTSILLTSWLMTLLKFRRMVRVSLSVLLIFFSLSVAHGQGAKQSARERTPTDADADHVEQRAEWFSHGRVIRGKSAAELRHRAYQAKMRARMARGPWVASAQANS